MRRHDDDVPARTASDRRRWLVLALAWAAQASGAAVFLGLPAIGPQLAERHGLGLAALGVAFAALIFGAGLSVIAWGALADRIGDARVMAGGLALAAGSLALLAWDAVGLQVPVLLALAGVGSASPSAASGRSVIRWFGARERGLAMGIRQTAMPVGAASGAIVLPALASGASVSWALAALGAGCAVMALVVIATPLLRGEAPARRARHVTGVLRDPALRRVVAVSALLSVPQLTLSSFLVVFLHTEEGWSIATAGALLAAIQLGGAAVRILAGRRSDVLGDRLGLLRRLAALEVAALLVLALATPGGGAALALAVVLAGLATLAWNGVAAVAAGELAPMGRTGSALGLQTSSVFLGGALAAPVFGALAASTSWSAAFAFLAIPALLAALILPRGARPTRPQHVDVLLARSLDCMSSAVSLIDSRDGRILYTNPAFERLTGYSAEQAVGRSWTIVEGPETDAGTAADLREALRTGRELRARLRHHRQDGSPYWSETFLSPVVDDTGAVTHFVSVQKDVTAQTEEAQRAAHLAYHDALTGLPNRTQVQEHLALAIARAKRSESALALLFLDLDGFKLVNDHHGHDAGDEVLQQMAGRWLGVAREGDLLARYGGDEFVLLMTDLDPAGASSAAAAAAERYVAAVAPPLTLEAVPHAAITLGVSVGVALFPEHGLTGADLLVAADAAMYEDKRRGGSAAAAVRWR